MNEAVKMVLNFMRDVDASLKIRGALLRLHALQPTGFTCRDLTAASDVSYETVRDFLKPRKRSYARVVDQRPAPTGKGRSINVYQLTEVGSNGLLNEMVELRRQLSGGTQLTRTDAFKSLLELEDTISDLEQATESHADELLEYAKSEIASCHADLEALKSSSPDFAPEFARQLEGLEKRVRHLGHATRVAMAAEHDFVHDVVVKYGGWVGVRPSAFDPVLMLFDGIAGQDPLYDNVVALCKTRNIGVAAFDVAEMAIETRHTLFRSVAWLREATPLALCDLVLTVNSKTEIGRTLATEFKSYSKFGSWKGWFGHNGTNPDPSPVRQSYIEKLAFYQAVDPINTRKTHICTMALTALEAADVPSSDWGNTIFRKGGKRRHELLNDPLRFLGEAVCLDAQFDKTTENSFKQTGVIYRVNTVSKGTLG